MYVCKYVCMYMYVYMCTYAHSSIHPSIRPSIHPSIYTCLYVHIRTHKDDLLGGQGAYSIEFVIAYAEDHQARCTPRIYPPENLPQKIVAVVKAKHAVVVNLPPRIPHLAARAFLLFCGSVLCYWRHAASCRAAYIHTRVDTHISLHVYRYRYI